MGLNRSTFLCMARIIATIGIFIFHFLELTVSNSRGIDNIAILSILIFCFLSGYLSFSKQAIPVTWLYRRISSIMVPYWFVIVPVIFINNIIQYKETTLLMDFFTLLGANLFMSNPIYVIAWYITFIIMLYIFVFFQSLSKNITLKLFIWMCGWLFFSRLLSEYYYFISFASGYFLAEIIPPPKGERTGVDTGNRILFSIQDNCYAFFLVHGGVLVLLSVKLKIAGFNMFFLGILISCIGAVILRGITKPFVAKISDKVVGLTAANLSIFK